MIMEKVEQLFKSVIKKLYNIDIDVDLTFAPKETGADFATNIAMCLVKNLKRNPFEIAEEIKGKILEDNLQKNLFESIEVAKPGFINIKMADRFYKQELDRYQENFLENMILFIGNKLT